METPVESTDTDLTDDDSSYADLTEDDFIDSGDLNESEETYAGDNY